MPNAYHCHYHVNKVITIVSSISILTREEGDFLDLGAGYEDDELDLNENEGSSVGITPLKVPIRTAVVTVPEATTDVPDAATPAASSEDCESERHEQEESDRDLGDDPMVSKEEEVEEEEEDDDDEDEAKSQRSRFHSERNPITMSSSGGSKTAEKPQPIRSLGKSRES
jgi:TFIIF-interacting CTD phosphatase-like protein